MIIREINITSHHPHKKRVRFLSSSWKVAAKKKKKDGDKGRIHVSNHP